MKIRPALERRWMLVAQSPVAASVALPRVGYLHTIRREYVCGSVIATEIEKFSPPKVLQTPSDFVVRMQAGVLWIEISDVEVVCKCN